MSELGTLVLPAVPQSVGEARRFARALLPAGDRTDTIVLLISEAVTNALTHSRSAADGKFTLVLSETGGAVRAEVIDEGGPTVPTRVEPCDLSTSGRGVALIEDLADRSGWFTDESARLHTWFDLDQAKVG